MSTTSTIKRALDSGRLPKVKKFRKGVAAESRLEKMSDYERAAIGAVAMTSLLAQAFVGRRAGRQLLRHALRHRGGAK